MLHIGLAAPAASLLQIVIQLIYLRLGRWRQSGLVQTEGDYDSGCPDLS